MSSPGMSYQGTNPNVVQGMSGTDLGALREAPGTRNRTSWPFVTASWGKQASSQAPTRLRSGRGPVVPAEVRETLAYAARSRRDAIVRAGTSLSRNSGVSLATPGAPPCRALQGLGSAGVNYRGGRKGGPTVLSYGMAPEQPASSAGRRGSRAR